MVKFQCVLVSPGILLPLYFGASESIMGHYLLVLPTHPDPTTFLVTIPRHRTAESIFHIFFFFFKDLNKSIASKIPPTHPDWVSLKNIAKGTTDPRVEFYLPK